MSNISGHGLSSLGLSIHMRDPVSRHDLAFRILLIPFGEQAVLMDRLNLETVAMLTLDGHKSSKSISRREHFPSNINIELVAPRGNQQGDASSMQQCMLKLMADVSTDA